MPRDNSPTDRRGYQRPPIGDDWAGAWDDLVEDQDELSIERGAIADRPSTGAYDDAMYYAVDQRTLWRWDAAASDWEAAGGLGTASDPIPGTTHLESVSTEDLYYSGDPPGALVQLNGDQSFPSDTLQDIAWETGTRDTDGLLNSTNNSVVIPEGVSYARVSVSIRVSPSPSSLKRIEARLNSGPAVGLPQDFPDSGFSVGQHSISGGWAPVTQGDEITVRMNQDSGSSIDLVDAEQTYLDVWLV